MKITRKTSSSVENHGHHPTGAASGRTSQTARRAGSAVAIALAAPLLAFGAASAQAESSTTGCTAQYSVTGQWQGGFQGALKVTNHGAALSTWTITWNFANGEKISQGWGAELSQSGIQVQARNASWNGSVPSGGSVDIGFIGSSAGAAGSPTSFSVNGVQCTGPSQTTSPTDTPTESSSPTNTPSPTDTPSPTETQSPSTNTQLFVDTSTQAFDAWEAATGSDKALLEKIAKTPASRWIGNWDSKEVSREEVRQITADAQNAGAIAQITIYAIPGRDCGAHSSGGVSTSEYAGWIDAVSAGIVGNPIVILEPDALAQLGDCDGQGDRVGFLKYAAQKLTEAGGEVYIDAGHSGWLTPSTVADRLNQVGFQYAKGFALNTSNYQTTASEKAYGEQISALTGGKKFVIDTSRNGNGSNGEWCNPGGRALGEKPVLYSEGSLRGLLWIKLPGESDGNCNGGPSAGAWWQSGALELARNAHW